MKMDMHNITEITPVSYAHTNYLTHLLLTQGDYKSYENIITKVLANQATEGSMVFAHVKISFT